MLYTFNHKHFPPKTSKQVKKERIEVINNLLDGNLLRFLRYTFKPLRYQLVYSVTLKRWVKRGLKKEVDYLKNKYVYPKHLHEVVAVTEVLVSKYDKELCLHTIKVAEAIIDLFDNDIWEYNRKRYNKMRTTSNIPLRLVTKEQALKEQKARGFVHINDFEDFKRNKYNSHIYSNVDSSYIYPENFSFRFNTKHPERLYIYVAQSLIGVEGYTRVETPL